MKREPLSWRVRLLLLAAIWGSSFLFIKVGLRDFAPLHVALGRMIFGTTVLLAFLALRREPLPHGRRVWGHLAFAGLFGNTLPFFLFAWGETKVSSVLAGIWNGTTPLLTMVVAFLMLPDERPDRDKVIGLTIGFIGVLLIVGPWQGVGSGALLGNLACLAAAACYGVAFPYLRKYLAGREESPLALAGGQLLCGTIQLAVLTLFFTGAPDLYSLRPVASVVVLGVLGTGIAYVVNYSIIRDAGATAASTVTYLLPIFATIVGMVFLGERLTWNQPAGAAVVLAGVAISQGRLPTSRRREATSIL
ncbi:MAG: DMT family transporter [Actinobacteria bacterium]|nr:DMT family transporter [Actinomycetota bacterium]